MSRKQIRKYEAFKHGIVSDAPENIINDITFLDLLPAVITENKIKFVGTSTKANLSSVKIEDIKKISLLTPSGVENFYLAIDHNSTYYLKKYDNTWAGLGLGTIFSVGYTIPQASELHKHKRIINLGSSLRVEFEPFLHSPNAFFRENYWYGYIKRDRFGGADTFDGYYLTIANLTTPSIISNYISGIADITMASEDVDVGTYFFFITFESDGNQESNFYTPLYGDMQYGKSQAISTHVVSTGTGKYIQVNFSLDPNILDRRITAINLYCAYSSNTSAKTPETGYYLLARIDMNNGNFYYNSGTSKYEIAVVLSKQSGLTSTYPSGYTAKIIDPVAGYTGSEEHFEIYQEFFTRNMSLGIDQLWTVDNYKYGVWYNGRMFISHPSFRDYSIYDINDYHDLPYDPKQVVLYSNINQPDKFFTKTSYIDVSTNDGDAVTGLHILNDNLVVVKEKNIFVIEFYNSGNDFDWRIKDFLQITGSPYPNAQLVVNGILYFLNEHGLWAFNGSEAKNISKGLYASKVSFGRSVDPDYDRYKQMYYDETENLLFINGNSQVYVFNFNDGSLTQLEDNSTTVSFLFDEISTGEVLYCTTDFNYQTATVQKLKDTTSAPSFMTATTNDLYVDGDTETYKIFYKVEILSNKNLSNLWVRVDGTLVSDGDLSSDNKTLRFSKIGKAITIDFTTALAGTEIEGIRIYYRPLSIRE